MRKLESNEATLHLDQSLGGTTGRRTTGTVIGFWVNLADWFLRGGVGDMERAGAGGGGMW